jgi:hypothetical protein
LSVQRHGAHSGTKALTVIGCMLAGATSTLFDTTRAPATIGSWLRGFKWSGVRQFDAVSRELLARLWSGGAGPAELSAPLTIDLDSTICAVDGRGKQGAGASTARSSPDNSITNGERRVTTSLRQARQHGGLRFPSPRPPDLTST